MKGESSFFSFLFTAVGRHTIKDPNQQDKGLQTDCPHFLPGSRLFLSSLRNNNPHWAPVCFHLQGKHTTTQCGNSVGGSGSSVGIYCINIWTFVCELYLWLSLVLCVCLIGSLREIDFAVIWKETRINGHNAPGGILEGTVGNTRLQPTCSSAPFACWLLSTWADILVLISEKCFFFPNCVSTCLTAKSVFMLLVVSLTSQIKPIFRSLFFLPRTAVGWWDRNPTGQSWFRCADWGSMTFHHVILCVAGWLGQASRQ